jgi:hypothetical protein
MGQVVRADSTVSPPPMMLSRNKVILWQQAAGFTESSMFSIFVVFLQ